MQIAHITHRDINDIGKSMTPNQNGVVPSFSPAMMMSEIPSDKISPIYFTGVKNKKKSSPYLKSTIDTMNQVYRDYEESLMEIKPEQISEMVNNIKSDTDYSENEILTAMRDVTQFGGVQSVEKIGKVLDENKIGWIGNTNNFLAEEVGYGCNENYNEFLFNDIGLNDTIDYLLNKKNIYPLQNGRVNVAIFLDDSKIDKLEKLSKQDKEEFNYLKSIPDIKYFMLSGFENGVNFFDRTRSVEEKTRELLNSGKDVDAEGLERLEKLGITPVVIENKKSPTEENIYQNLAPLKIKKEQLFALVDANFQHNLRGEQNKFIAKDITANYLKDNLLVYSPERLSKELKDFHKEIVDFAKTKGKKEKDLVYLVPENNKSYSYINYSYKKINDLPDEAFVSAYDIGSSKTKGKTVIILDDCSMTGSSLLNLQTSDIDYNDMNSMDGVICACLYGTQRAKNELHFFEVWKDVDIIFHREEKMPSIKYDDNDLGIILGNGFKEGDKAMILPYMSPDNDSVLVSAMALFHNTNMQSGTNPNNPIYTAVKASTADLMDIYNLAKNLSSHDYEKEAVDNIGELNLRRLNIGEIPEIYYSYINNL